MSYNPITRSHTELNFTMTEKSAIYHTVAVKERKNQDMECPTLILGPFVSNHKKSHNI